MATCGLRTHNHEYFFLFLFYMFLHFHSPHAIQFNYTDFSDRQGLNTSGDADFASRKYLSLTKSEIDNNLTQSGGRTVYSEEMHLWDAVTGKSADFITHFSFRISLLKGHGTDGGDGIAFFLAPNGSHIPDKAVGGCLALITNCSDFNTSGRAIVAVEFDTYKNHWDPIEDHIGININSIKSETTRTLSRGMKNGLIGNATISYNSQTRNLSVFLTYLNDTVFNGNYSLSYAVNLSQVLTEWVTVGFSSTTGSSIELHKIYSWQFNSTELASATNNGDGIDIGLVVGSTVGSFLFTGMILILFFCWRKRTGRPKEEDPAPDDPMNHEFEHGIGPRRFSYAELVQATNNFAEEGKLGEGGFGGVYKGFLTHLNNVAVKRVSRGSKQGRKEYMSEVKIISRLRHKNLVQLMGWCHEMSELLLIYEFMPNGSLDSHIFRGEKMLSWDLRYKIVLGLASALLYLHEEWEQCVVHRDIKSSNIMLDSSFNAKLGDFGLARLTEQELSLKTTGLAGTFGYMAPEYISTGRASKGSDVFSFGVVALEIACGRRSMEARNEEVQISLVAWVWESYGNEMLFNVVDKKLCMDFDMKQMECLLMAGLWCTHPDYKLRPSIRQALQVLNFEATLPNLPKKMPVPRYDVPSSTSSSQSLLSYAADTVGR